MVAVEAHPESAAMQTTLSQRRRTATILRVVCSAARAGLGHMRPNFDGYTAGAGHLLHWEVAIGGAQSVAEQNLM